MDALRNVEALVEQLKARADVHVVRARMGKPAAAKQLTKAALSDDLAELYGAMNGCSLCWEFLDDKIQQGSLEIPGLAKLKFQPASAFGIGDLQPELADLEIATIDLHQPEAETFVCLQTGQVYFASHSQKDGLHLIAESLSAYLERGASYGFGWYWMQESNEALRTRERLAGPVRVPGKIGPQSRVAVTSEIETLAYHGHGMVVAQQAKHFLVQLDYGARLWFQRNELQAVGADDPYEQRLVQREAWLKRIEKAKTAKALADQLLALTEADPHARMSHEVPLGKQSLSIPAPSFVLAGLLAALPAAERLPLLARLLAQACEASTERAQYVAQILLGALFVATYDATHREALGPLAKLVGPAAFETLQQSIATVAAGLGEDAKYAPKAALFEKRLAVDLSFLGIEDPKWLRHAYVRYIDGHLVHWK